MKTVLVFVCCATLFLLRRACAAPFESESDKTGEDEAHQLAPAKSVDLEGKVRETVHKAEEAASRAAQDSIRHGHKAETRVTKFKELKAKHKVNEDSEEPQSRKHSSSENDGDSSHATKRVKEHRVNQKPRGYGKLDLGDSGTASNPYKEDTNLEDRLALEAEEEKKYENGEGYGGGGSENWGKGANWASNIQRQDAAEKQSIQAQVASESAHELDEIQRAITAESQSSRGSATMGNSGATVVQVNGRQMSDEERVQGQARQETAQALRAAGAQLGEAQGKSLESAPGTPDQAQVQYGGMMSQGQSFGMPGEAAGAPQSVSASNLGPMSQSFTSMSPEGQGANELSQASVGGALAGGLEGGLSQGSLGGALTGGGGLTGGAIEAGGLGGGSLSAGAGAVGPAAAFGASAGANGGVADSAMSRMMGGAAESPMAGVMGGTSEPQTQSIMGASMQNMAALMSDQSQGSMLQPQSMPGAAPSMLGAGALQGFGAGGQFAGAQQMGFKKRSKTARVKDDGSKHQAKTNLGLHSGSGHHVTHHKERSKDRKSKLPTNHQPKHS